MARIGTKPNGIHYLDVHIEVEGKLKRQRVSTDTRDKSDAEQQRRAWIAGVHPKHPAMGGDVAPKGRVSALLSSSNVPVRKTEGWTIERLLNRCYRDPEVWAETKSQMTLRSNIKLLTARMGDWLATEVSHPRLKDVVADMKEEGYAPASIKRHMAMISKALQMATEWEDNGKPILMGCPKMPKIKVKNEKDRVLSFDEEKLVFAAIDARLLAEPARQWGRFRMLVRVLLDTGFRKSEAFMLTDKHVTSVWDAKGNERLVLSLGRYTTKNDKPRLVPCTAAVEALLPALNAQAVGGRWFPMESTAWVMWHQTREDVKKMGADIGDVTIHTLRHTCLTRLGKAGMELQRLSQWAGHSNTKITERYVHLDVQELLDGAAMLGTIPANRGKRSGNPELCDNSISSINTGSRANLGTVSLQ